MSDLCKVVFIGAINAGKSTLMAAWYEIADRVYDLTPLDEEDAGARNLLQMVESIRNGERLMATPPGQGSRAEFSVKRKEKHCFDLSLVDYSGETVRDALDGRLDDSLADEVIRDVKEANAIVFVFNPEELTGATAATQNGDRIPEHETLLILKQFIKQFEREQVLRRTWFYISHADVAREGTCSEAKATIQRALSTQVLNGQRGDIIVGNSLQVRRSGKVSFPKRGPTAWFVHDAMTSFETEGPAAAIAYKNRTWHSRLGCYLAQRKKSIAMGLAAAFVAVISLAFVSSEVQDRAEWAEMERQFQQMETMKPVTYPQAQAMREQLKDWEKRAKEQFDRFYSEDSQGRVEALRKYLQSIPEPPPPKGIGDVIEEIKRLRTRHGPNLRGFYQALEAFASAAKADRAWNAQARREWSEVEAFSAAMLAGVTLVMETSWLETGRFWTRGTGAGTLRAELWIAGPGAPRPFGPKTSGGAAIVTPEASPVKGGDGRYSYTWSGTFRANQPLQIGDQIWVRFYHSTPLWKRSGEYWHYAVPLQGLDQIGWFNTRYQVSDLGLTLRINVYAVDASGARLTPPASLRQASR